MFKKRIHPDWVFTITVTYKDGTHDKLQLPWRKVKRKIRELNKTKNVREVTCECPQVW